MTLRTQHFGYEEEHLVVFRETFTGNGGAVTFQLTGNVGNAVFETGAWDVANVEILMAADVSKTSRAALYDSALPLTRHKISVSSISAAGLVTLDYAPMAENFYIWYWYDLEGMALSDYYRDDYVNSLETDSGVSVASGITTDTVAFNGWLSATQDTVQKALDIFDDTLRPTSTPVFTGLSLKSGSLTYLTVGYGGPCLLTLGVEDGAAGELDLYGYLTGNADGGAIKLFTAADHDTTIDYFKIEAFEDDLVIGPSTDFDAMKFTNNKDLHITAGTVSCYDLTDGYVPYHVSDAAGLANSPFYVSGINVSMPAGGALYIGVNDTTTGAIHLYGAAVTFGGNFVLYTAADYDDTIGYWNFMVLYDDFQQGPSTDSDAFTFTAEGDLKITAGTVSCSDLTDGYVPYHVSDVAGLANSCIFLTSGGNVGFGTSDIEAWDLNYRGIHFGSAPALMYGGGLLWLMRNVYYDGNWRYRSAGTAQNLYFDGDGATQFMLATAGSADAVLTWRAAVYIAPTGRVGITTVAPVSPLEVEDDATSASMIVKITQDDANVYGLVIGNDTYSTTDTNGLLFKVADTGAPTISWTAGVLTLSGGPVQGTTIAATGNDLTGLVGQFARLCVSGGTSYVQSYDSSTGYTPLGFSGSSHTFDLSGRPVLYLTATGFGIGCASPVGNIEVEDGGTGNSILLKITQDDATVYGLMIGNDTYSTNDLLGLGAYLSDAGSAYVVNYAAGDFYVVSKGTANTSNLYLGAESAITLYDWNAGAPVQRMSFDIINSVFQLDRVNVYTAAAVNLITLQYNTAWQFRIQSEWPATGSSGIDYKFIHRINNMDFTAQLFKDYYVCFPYQVRVGSDFTSMPAPATGGILIGEHGAGGACEIQFLSCAVSSGFGTRFVGNSSDGSMRIERRENSASWSDCLKINGGDLFILAGTVSCSDLSDGYVPYHVNDATGLANSPIQLVGADLLIGPVTDQDALKLDSNKDLYLTDGDLYVQYGGTTGIGMVVNASAASITLGSNDAIRGFITIYGHATGQPLGAILNLYLSADYDSTFQAFVIRAYEDDLEIGLTSDSDALKLDSNKDFYITGGDLLVYGRDANVLTLGSGGAGLDYILKFDGENNDGTLTWMEDEAQFKFSNVLRMETSLYRRYYHIALASSNPGASGATWVSPGANSTGGWRLDAASEVLHGETDVHADWDGATDLNAEVRFYVNVNNTGGGAGDTVDIKIIFYYKGVGDTVTKTQTVEVATVVGASAQYKAFEANFTINWDEVSNVVEVGDVIGLTLNLETDTSEVDDIVVTGISFSYSTTHTGIEAADI